MLRNVLATVAALLATSAFAVEVNNATQAELERVTGIGTTISSQIVSERKKREFKDWNDLVVRIQGVGDRSAAKFSEGGLTVNSKPYPGPVEPKTVPKASTSKNAGKAKGAKSEATVKSPAAHPASASASHGAAASAVKK